MNKIKFKICIFFIKRKINRYFKVDRKFLESYKSIFLDRYSKNFTSNRILKKSNNRNIFFTGIRQYVFIFSSVFLIFLISLVAFTNEIDMEPYSPLYPFKRISENFEKQIISEENQAELHLELAQKRIEEINKIKNKPKKYKLADKKIKELKEESKKEIELVLENVVKTKNTNIPLGKKDSQEMVISKSICKSLVDVVKVYNSVSDITEETIDENSISKNLDNLNGNINIKKEDEILIFKDKDFSCSEIEFLHCIDEFSSSKDFCGQFLR